MDKSWPSDKQVVEDYKYAATMVAEEPEAFMPDTIKTLANRFLEAIEEIERLNEENNSIKTERDAAVSDLRRTYNCSTCIGDERTAREWPCSRCDGESGWTWIGPRK